MTDMIANFANAKGRWGRLFVVILLSKVMYFRNVMVYKQIKAFRTRKAEVLNSRVMKITANENDINDILQTFLELLLSSSVHMMMMISGVIETFAIWR